jgi:hypothetical protein
MKIRADFSEAKKDIEALSKLSPELEKELDNWKNESVRELKYQARRMNKADWRKTGALAKSIGGKKSRTAAGLNVVVGSGVFAPEVPYALIQELGGTVTPKRRDWLAIPFRGVKGFPREYQDTFFAKSKRGNLILFQKRGKDKEPLFAMKKEAKIPASKWFSSVMDKQKEKLAAMLSENNILARLGVTK